jgi:peptidoglycan/xylan/chitin deacetylase (PgdA/CDA1 family)
MERSPRGRSTRAQDHYGSARSRRDLYRPWVRWPGALLSALILLGLLPAAAVGSIHYHGPRDAPVVALTFDDGLNPDSVRSILRTLDREGVVATFFPMSDAVRANPDLWRRVAARHPIGNHTIDHPNLTRLSRKAIVRQLTVSRDVIERVTGVPMIPWMRPPYGAWNADVLQASRQAGYRGIALWDIDTNDWRKPSRTRLIQDATQGRDGSIVLMHTLPNTAEALPAIIDRYRKRGFEFVSIPELLEGRPGTIPAHVTAGPAEPTAQSTMPEVRRADATRNAREAAIRWRLEERSHPGDAAVVGSVRGSRGSSSGLPGSGWVHEPL